MGLQKHEYALVLLYIITYGNPCDQKQKHPPNVVFYLIESIDSIDFMVSASKLIWFIPPILHKHNRFLFEMSRMAIGHRKDSDPTQPNVDQQGAGSRIGAFSLQRHRSGHSRNPSLGFDYTCEVARASNNRYHFSFMDSHCDRNQAYAGVH